jgi:hypothetical protein
MVAAALVVPAFVAAGGADPASALAATCSPSTELDYDQGYYSNPSQQTSTYEGVSAQFTDAGGYVLCSGDKTIGNVSADWDMIAGVNGDPGSWEQAGTLYVYGYGSCVKKFAQELTPGGNPQNFFGPGCVQPGDTNQFWVQSVNANEIRDNVGTFIIHQTNFGISTLGLPISVQFGAETYQYLTDIPGSTANPQKHASEQVQGQITGGWYPTSGHITFSAQTANNRWGLSQPCCATMDFWTVR